MVLDNVDDVETFFPSRKRKRDETDTDSPTSLATYVPQSLNGSILVTSRSKDAVSSLAGGHNRIREVLAMSIGEGLQLLRNKLCNPPLEESALKLLHALEHIPLAIIEAAAYINRCTNMTVSRYLDNFQKNKTNRVRLLKCDVVELRRDQSASSSILNTWQMSFEQIRHERESAADLLSLMSFFDSQGIPEWTLRRFRKYMVKATGVEDDEDEDQHQNQDEDKDEENGDDNDDYGFDEDLTTLRAYSLVSTTADNVCDMHALVQFCTRAWLSSHGDAERWEGEFIELTAQELIAQEPLNVVVKNWEKWHQLFPHVELLFNSKPSGKDILLLWTRVLKHAAFYLFEKGDYTAATQATVKILAIEEKSLGPSDMTTLFTMSLLAVMFQSQGRHEEAVRLSQQALEAKMRELGEYHPSTLESVTHLASALRSQGKDDEAENLYQKALADCKKELGEKHYSTLSTKSNLASLMCSRKNHSGAENLYQEVLGVYEKELGKKHYLTLSTKTDLASVMRYQNRYSEVEKLLQEVLGVGKKELRERHSLILRSMSDMSGILSAQGRYRESEKLYREALEISTKKLGERHLDTLMLTGDLARSLHRLHRYVEATKLYQQAHNELTEQYGSHHPYTVRFHLLLEIIQKEMELARLSGEAHGQQTEDSL